MGFRFQRCIRIFKGFTIILNNSGSSWRVGRPGASVNFRGDNVTGHVEIPGTDLSYRESLHNQATHEHPAARLGGARVVFWLALFAVVAYVLHLMGAL